MGAIEQILEAAPQRIHQHRAAEIVVKVEDRTGKPVPNAKVEVCQTRHAFLFGCNVLGGDLGTEEEIAKFREHFAALFNYATLPFYWSDYEPEKGKTLNVYINELLDWCAENKITTHGHPLVWNHHASTPEWLPQEPQEVLRVCEERVKGLVEEFNGRINVWSVINEPTDCFREETVDFVPYRGVITDTWQWMGKIPFSRHFFTIARQANPGATLMINDYRRDVAYEELIEQLIEDSDMPTTDAIGIQAHMHGKYWGAPYLWNICQRFARFGLPLHFTEATLISGKHRRQEDIDWDDINPNWHSTLHGEKRQARNVAEFFTLLFSHPAVEAITWFELLDGGWLGAPGGLLRRDRHRTPKPVYRTLMNLIKGEWWTNAAAKTDQEGRCVVRAFFGDHQITVEHRSVKETVRYQHLKCADHALKIII